LHDDWKRVAQTVDVKRFIEQIITSRRQEAMARNAEPLETSIELLRAAGVPSSLPAPEAAKAPEPQSAQAKSDVNASIERRLFSGDRRVTPELREFSAERREHADRRSSKKRRPKQVAPEGSPSETKQIRSKAAKKATEPKPGKQQEVNTTTWEDLGTTTSSELLENVQEVASNPKVELATAQYPSLMSGIRTEERDTKASRTVALRDFRNWVDKATKSWGVVERRDGNYVLRYDSLVAGHEAPTSKALWIEHNIVSLEGDDIHFGDEQFGFLDEEVVTRIQRLAVLGKALVYARDHGISPKHGSLTIDQAVISDLYRRIPKQFETFNAGDGWKYKISLEDFE
jgi:hypothetical protein